MHVSKANAFVQIVVLLSTERDAKMARTVARISRLGFMAAPFLLQLVGLHAHAKLDEWLSPLT